MLRILTGSCLFATANINNEHLVKISIMAQMPIWAFKPKSVFIPFDRFQPIAIFVTKDEHGFTEGIETEIALDDRD